jgi:hypothetical protein
MRVVVACEHVGRRGQRSRGEGLAAGLHQQPAGSIRLPGQTGELAGDVAPAPLEGRVGLLDSCQRPGRHRPDPWREHRGHDSVAGQCMAEPEADAVAVEHLLIHRAGQDGGGLLARRAAGPRQQLPVELASEQGCRLQHGALVRLEVA